jgi:hypothetical protein
MATPFVQGKLRDEHLTVLLETECAHCGQTIEIEVDSSLNYRVLSDGAEPLIFTPMVDFATLEDPSIIDAF